MRGTIPAFHTAFFAAGISAHHSVGGADCRDDCVLHFTRQLEILKRTDLERAGLLRLAFHQLGSPLTILNWSLECSKGPQRE